jgi:hypothetical protein
MPSLYHAAELGILKQKNKFTLFNIVPMTLGTRVQIMQELPVQHAFMFQKIFYFLVTFTEQV